MLQPLLTPLASLSSFLMKTLENHFVHIPPWLLAYTQSNTLKAKRLVDAKDLPLRGTL
jgi:hypothetical protein